MFVWKGFWYPIDRCNNQLKCGRRLVVKGRCIVYIVWVGWWLHLRCGFQCCLCWTDFCCWSYGLKWQQFEDMAWNFWCWRYLDFYCKRLNPTSQSWTQIRMDSREGNTGRWETLWACRAQVCILICHGGCMWQSTGIKINCCLHLPNLGIVICRSYWVIDLLFNTRLIHKRFRLWFLLWHSPHIWVFVKLVILLGSCILLWLSACYLEFLLWKVG